jgi:hypothetical protein
MRLEEGMVVDASVVGALRCGLPTLIGQSGNRDSRRLIVVAAEWPEFYRQRDKSSNEQLHLNRFAADFQRGLGREPYVDLKPGERPDFSAADERGPIGVDCTQLVAEDRLGASARFQRLRDALYDVGPRRLRHLRGRLIYVHIDSARGVTLPLNEVMGDLLGAIEQHKPFDASYSALPRQADPRHVDAFPGGKLVSAALSIAPTTPFFAFMGFDVALAYTTVVYEDEAWDELQRRVSDHDQPGFDDLIVTAGAPGVDGYAYPSDAVMAQAVIDSAENWALTAERITRVYVHDWSGRGIFLLTPGKVGAEHLCGDPPIARHAASDG